MSMLTGHGFGLVLVIGISGMVAAQEDPPLPPALPPPAENKGVWRDGPPTERPADDPGPPPGPGLFYVPGEYHPDGDAVVWREGFWAREQPGWTWSPARWVRLSDGWTFREGAWVRTPDSDAPPQARPAQNEQAAGEVIVDSDGAVIEEPIVRSEIIIREPPTILINPYGPGFGYPSALPYDPLWATGARWGGPYSYPYPGGALPWTSPGVYGLPPGYGIRPTGFSFVGPRIGFRTYFGIGYGFGPFPW